MGDRGQRPPFHAFIDGALEALPGFDDLGAIEELLLTFLLRHAVWDEGLYRATLAELGERFKMRPDTVAMKLDALQATGYLSYDFPRGHRGTILLDIYTDVMLVTDDQGAAIKRAHDKEHVRRAKAVARSFKRHVQK